MRASNETVTIPIELLDHIKEALTALEYRGDEDGALDAEAEIKLFRVGVLKAHKEEAGRIFDAITPNPEIVDAIFRGER